MIKPQSSLPGDTVLIRLAVLQDVFSNAQKHSRMTMTVSGSTNARSEVSPTGRRRVVVVLVYSG